MRNNLLPITKAQKAWQAASKDGKEINLDVDLEIYRKLLNIISVGPFYYYIFDLKSSSILFVSPGITEVLGYTPDQFTLTFSSGLFIRMMLSRLLISERNLLNSLIRLLLKTSLSIRYGLTSGSEKAPGNISVYCNKW